MKNKLTPVSNDTNNSQNTPLSPLEEAMNDVNNQIYDILPKENQIFLKEKEALRKKLLLKLEEEVKKISESVNYDYEDYQTKLSVDDWKIEETMQKILKENKSLAKIYDELLDLYKTESWKKIIQKKLFIDYFEDLVYESMEWVYFTELEYKNLGYELQNKNWEELVEVMKALPQGLKILALEWNNLWEKLSWKELVEFMKSITTRIKKFDVTT